MIGQQNALDQEVLNEIKYYISFSLLKRLMQQEKITPEICRKANVAIAEKYGVSQLTL